MKSLRRAMTIGLAALVLAFTAPNCGGSSGGSGGGSDGPKNHAPTVTITSPTNNPYRGETILYSANCIDDEDGVIPSTDGVWDLTQIESGKYLNSLVSFYNIPLNSTLGTYVSTALCSDSKGKVGEADVTYTILNNKPSTPNINPGTNLGGWEGDNIAFIANSTDLDGTLTYEIINSNLPNDPNISFNSNTGSFNWPTDCNDSGNYTLEVRTKDNDNAISNSTLVSFTIWNAPTCSVPTN